MTTLYQNEQLPPGARSFTLTGLKTGVTWTVGVAQVDLINNVPTAGDIAQARLQADYTAVTLTLAESVGGSLPVVTVGYEAPDSNPLRDADMAMHPVPDFTGQPVTNNTTGDTTPPVIESREINGTTLTVTFNERLDESSVPPANQFSAFIGGVGQAATGIQVDRNVVTLTITAARHGQSVTDFRYTKPTGQNVMPLRDLSGNEVATMTRQPVTNNTPPAFASAAVDGATLTITFDGALDPDSVPSGDAFGVLFGEFQTQTLVLGHDQKKVGTPHMPTGTAEQGPAPGEITLRWEPPTTGPTDKIISWNIYAEERTTGNVIRLRRVLGSNARSFTVTGLKTGVTYTVGVAAVRRHGGATLIGDIGQARLKAPEGLDLAAVNPVAIGGATVPLAIGYDNTEPNAPHAPTGTAEPGPGVGEITLKWQPATTGPTDNITRWFIYAQERTAGNVGGTAMSVPAAARSYTLTGLKTGVTWTVGVQASRRVGSLHYGGDIGQARLEAGLEADLTTVTLTLAESVGGSLPVVTVGYEAPDSNPLRDADNAMNPVPDFTGQPVTNNTTGDTTPPADGEQGDQWDDADRHLQRAPGRELGAAGQPVHRQHRRYQPVCHRHPGRPQRGDADLRRRAPRPERDGISATTKPTGAGTMPLRDLSGNELPPSIRLRV